MIGLNSFSSLVEVLNIYCLVRPYAFLMLDCWKGGASWNRNVSLLLQEARCGIEMNGYILRDFLLLIVAAHFKNNWLFVVASHTS